MQRDYAYSLIESNQGKEVRVSFLRNLRTNVYGKFVMHSDYEYLKSKGIVRFLSHQRYDKYAEAFNKDEQTFLFKVEDFKVFEIYSCPGRKESIHVL